MECIRRNIRKMDRAVKYAKETNCCWLLFMFNMKKKKVHIRA